MSFLNLTTFQTFSPYGLPNQEKKIAVGLRLECETLSVIDRYRIFGIGKCSQDMVNGQGHTIY